jgi:hypothetical protein
MVSRPALQSATKTAGKNNGGQALDLLTIALKTDSNKPNAVGNSVKAKIYWHRNFSA